MSLQLVRRLEEALLVKIAEKTDRVMGGQLPDREYGRLTGQVDALKYAIQTARDLLKEDEDEDEGEGDAISIRGRDRRR